MADVVKRRRVVPVYKTRIASIPIHGMRVEDVELTLGTIARERNGQPRCYIDSQGNLIIAVDRHTA